MVWNGDWWLTAGEGDFQGHAPLEQRTAPGSDPLLADSSDQWLTGAKREAFWKCKLLALSSCRIYFLRVFEGCLHVRKEREEILHFPYWMERVSEAMTILILSSRLQGLCLPSKHVIFSGRWNSFLISSMHATCTVVRKWIRRWYDVTRLINTQSHVKARMRTWSMRAVRSAFFF